MSIRTKILLLVIAVAAVEAAAAGLIAYRAIRGLSRPASEIREITDAVAHSRGVGAALARAGDPERVFLPDDGAAAERFRADMAVAEERFQRCATATCHGSVSSPPHMSLAVGDQIRTIREDGLALIAARGPGSPIPWQEWVQAVNRPSRGIAVRTDKMSKIMMVQAHEIEEATRRVERRAVTWLVVATGVVLLAAIGLAWVPAQRIADLERREAEIQRATRLASVGLIAGTVAHNLGNPLTSVVLNAEALLEKIHPEDSRRRIVEDLLRDGRRCRSIAAELRTLAGEGIEDIPCSIRSVVDEAVRLTRFQWEPKGCDVRVEPFADFVLGDSSKFLRELARLIGQAAGTAGEIRIRVRPEEVEVEGGGVRRIALSRNGRLCGTAS